MDISRLVFHIFAYSLGFSFDNVINTCKIKLAEIFLPIFLVRRCRGTQWMSLIFLARKNINKLKTDLIAYLTSLNFVRERKELVYHKHAYSVCWGKSAILANITLFRELRRQDMLLSNVYDKTAGSIYSSRSESITWNLTKRNSLLATYSAWMMRSGQRMLRKALSQSPFLVESFVCNPHLK